MAKQALVVDDDPTIRNLMGTLLRRKGFAITHAVDGEEAIAFLDGSQDGKPARSFDLVVLDLMMPRKSGWEVIEFIEKRLPALRKRVMVVSAAGEDRLSQLKTAQGGVLSKPFGADEFYGCVDRCLRG